MLLATSDFKLVFEKLFRCILHAIHIIFFFHWWPCLGFFSLLIFRLRALLKIVVAKKNLCSHSWQAIKLINLTRLPDSFGISFFFVRLQMRALSSIARVSVRKEERIEASDYRLMIGMVLPNNGKNPIAICIQYFFSATLNNIFFRGAFLRCGENWRDWARWWIAIT